MLTLLETGRVDRRDRSRGTMGQTVWDNGVRGPHIIPPLSQPLSESSTRENQFNTQV